MASPSPRNILRIAVVLGAVGYLAYGLAARGPARHRPDGRLPLTRCRLEGVSEEVRCGTLRVPEDRAAPGGRKLGLRVAVVPALAGDPRPDPLFILAGGPGQAAAELVAQVLPIFDRVHQTRDLVFVDQRGTGQSSPLECEDSQDAGLAERFREGIDEPALRGCLAGYADAGIDVRQYLTPQAMDDLDEVRSALGYDKIDLWGASYGTRAALVYLRRHGEHVRAAVIDGVAPPTDSLLLSAAPDAQRAFELIFQGCEQDPSCRATYPDLRGKFTDLLARLRKEPAKVTVAHPLTGAPTELTITADAFALNLHGLLYVPEISSLLPLIIQRASQGDFGPFVAQAYGVSGSIGHGISQGMFFSVICAEDAPAATPEAIAKATAGTYMGAEFADELKQVCAFWPRGALPGGYHQLVRSDVPVLLLTGELDPVTPPQHAEATRAGLSHGRALVVPGVGHGATPQGCVPALVYDFLEAGTADALDAGCAERLTRPPFFVSFAGPPP